MKLATSIVLCAWLGAPLGAQVPMTVEEFEDYVTGHTFIFGSQGAPYGMEEFRPGRRTTWAFIGDECREGHWFAREEQICFIYDDFPSQEHCWVFWQGDTGLNARFVGEGDGEQTELYEVQRSAQPMFCPGPEVGV